MPVIQVNSNFFSYGYFYNLKKKKKNRIASFYHVLYAISPPHVAFIAYKE